MYQEKAIEKARDLIDYLSPLNRERWPREGYVFRGQPCSTYNLVPAAYRPQSIPSTRSLLGRLGEPKGDIQVYFEVIVLQKFLEACDRSGIQVIGDSRELRNLLAAPDQYTIDPKAWPPEIIYPVLATAQHHGIPTCLLDWTRRSYVAAYFAASAALKQTNRKDGHLAVWALSINSHRAWKKISLLELPGGTSANLSAQEGVFTVSRLNAGRGEKLDYVGLEYEEEIYKHPFKDQPSLLKITLPIDEAAELLWLCEDLGVKGSVLFPGYEGVAREVIDFAYGHATND
ncbi:FRG domain-containing protein [Vreelandella lionensis]|uniref:FRG domain-containing protein n=1 Tax=Vreelandella lionensis TaxID=1144478 RepID=UPI0009F410BF|nr:FRG domain-containing protein [Halomonas lionensis]